MVLNLLSVLSPKSITALHLHDFRLKHSFPGRISINSSGKYLCFFFFSNSFFFHDFELQNQKIESPGSILLEQHLISQNAGEDSYHPLTLVDLALKNIWWRAPNFICFIFSLIFVLSRRCMLLNAFFILYLSDYSDKKPFSSLAHIKRSWTKFNVLYFLNLTHHDTVCYMVSCYDNQITRMMREVPPLSSQITINQSNEWMKSHDISVAKSLEVPSVTSDEVKWKQNNTKDCFPCDMQCFNYKAGISFHQYSMCLEDYN